MGAGRPASLDAAHTPGVQPVARAGSAIHAQRAFRRDAADHSTRPRGLPTFGKRAEVDWHDRVHFFALSAQLMRRILVDAARARAAAKRGGRAARVEHASGVDLDQIPTADSNASTLCALDDALESLTRIDPRRAHVIELRFFGGLSVEETAEVLQVSAPERDARLAIGSGVARARAAR